MLAVFWKGENGWQRLSAFRIAIRYCFRNAKPSSVFAPERRDSQQHQGSRGASGRKRLFGETERTRQRHVHTCSQRFKSESSRTQVLGDSPKEVREHTRRSLEPGYYLSSSGRNATRILHFLGDCCMVPGIDCVWYHFVGRLMPSISEFYGVCKLCSKKGSVRIHESSGTGPLLRRRRERSEPDRNFVLAVRQEAKAKSPVQPDGCYLSVGCPSVLNPWFPLGFEGRACTVLQG